MKIEADFDDLNAPLDVQGTDGAADIVDECHAARAEAVIVEFQPNRPNIRERPFKPGARGPAKSGLQSSKIVYRHCIECAVAIARPGGTTFAVEQPIVPCIADACGGAGQ